MRKIIVALGCLLTISYGSIIYANDNLIPREILFGNSEKLSPALSPDGRHLAYLAPDQNNVLNVWLRDLSGKEMDQCITTEAKRGVPSFCWEFDNKHILYVQDRDGDENWHLYQTDIYTKVTKNLTPFDGVSASMVAYIAEFPKEMLIKLNKRNPALFDVYRLNLENGSLTLEVENQNNVIQWLADYKLIVRASGSFNEEGQTIIQVRDDGNSPWHELMRWNAEDEGELLSFSPDGLSLYITSNKGTNTTSLLKVNLADGSQETIAQDPQFDLGSQIMKNPTSHAIEAVGIEREYSEWITLDPKLDIDFAFLAKTREEMSVISRDLADQHWIVMYSSDVHPSHYYLYDRSKKENQFLFSAQPRLEKYSLSQMTPISFNARDGMKLYGYLTLPVGLEPKNLPTILLVHGGPWARDSWGFDPWAQWLSNRGYAVLQINFRGSTGYGKDYLNAGNKEWAGKMHTDLLDAKQWMIAHAYTNPEKVALFGGSYGGYATLVGLTFTPEEFCCGVDIVGPSNLVTLIETIPPYWSPLLAVFNIRIGNIKTEKGFLESRSPLFKADKICRPLFIAQGANDPRVKQAESDQIVTAMRKNHQEVEYLLIPDEGHGFKRPENNLKFCSLAEYFLHKHLGGRVEAK